MEKEMKLQVLVAAMHQTDSSLVEKMNIRTDAVVGNQCDRCANEEYRFDGFSVTYYSRPDRGVGLNRNEALLHSTGDILLFADDDEVLADGYAEMVSKAFAEHPKADGMIFNIQTDGMNMGRRQNKKCRRIRIYNALNYGAVRLAVRADAIRRENISFHTCFGGGTRYGSGEDTLFIVDMLKHKLRLYTYPACIASIDQTASTWFTGYNEKYLFDKGALYGAISRFWAPLLCLQDIVRHKNKYRGCELTFWQMYKQMLQGSRNYQSLTPYSETSK